MRKRDEAQRARWLARAVRERLSYANVAATLALCIALGTGGALAASQIGPKEIAENAVRAKHIKRSAVHTPKIRDGAVTSPKLACKGNSPVDRMVRAGSVCIDKYEASVWSSPAGGTQYGVSSDDYPCSNLGQNCSNIYARSLPGVTPSRFITYFQAQQALANSGKRLPTNAEWQQAVASTPDDTGAGTTPCNTRGSGPVNTGSATGCVSRFGAHDMVGNLSEWVADWGPASTGCPGWGTSDDLMCLSGASTTVQGPGALLRGGVFFDGAGTGPLAVTGSDRPANSSPGYGFRGAR